MSSEYTTETGDTGYTESGDTEKQETETPAESTQENETTEENENPNPEENANTEEKDPEQEQEKEPEQEAEKEPEPEPQPEPEPEPEPDPLEGLCYQDDPKQPLNPYGNKYYWEARYRHDSTPLEWYHNNKAFNEIFEELVNKQMKVLVIGNGNSELPVYLQEKGVEQIEAIDFSSFITKQMKKAHKDKEGITFKEMDVREMKYPAGEFMSILDKGCLDCVMYLGIEQVNQALSEISRVLKKRGVYICITTHREQVMRKILDNPAGLLLELETVKTIEKPLPSDTPIYVYILRKIGKLLT